MAASASLLRDHVLVTIHLLRSSKGKPRGIQVFPARRGDSVIFARGKGSKPRPHVPHRVLWFADELRRGERLRIRQKRNLLVWPLPSPSKAGRWKGPFPATSWDIDPALGVVSSGEATLPVGWIGPFTWYYSITWRTGGGTEILDPPIIIIPDP